MLDCLCKSLSLSRSLPLYIYIVIYRPTVSFYQNSSVWLGTKDARSRDRNPSNFMLDCVCVCVCVSARLFMIMYVMDILISMFV